MCGVYYIATIYLFTYYISLILTNCSIKISTLLASRHFIPLKYPSSKPFTSDNNNERVSTPSSSQKIGTQGNKNYNSETKIFPENHKDKSDTENNKKEEKVEIDWDEDYDPSKPTLFEDYWNSEERISEENDWNEFLKECIRRKQKSKEENLDLNKRKGDVDQN